MRLRSVVLVLAVAGCATVPPVPSGPSAKGVAYRSSSFVFPTGLRAVVYQDHAARRAMVDVSYGVGMRDEDPAHRGLAHLVEHLAFRGRQGGAGAATLWDRLRTGGFPFNGVTSPDSTDFFASGRPDQLETLLGLEAARMVAPLAHVEEDDFVRERAVVASEQRLRRAPGTVADQLDAVRAVAFRDTLYGGSDLATAEEVERLTLADAKGWSHAHYRPEQAIVVVVSPLPPEEVLAAIAKRFGGLASRGKDAAPTPPAPRTPPSIDLARSREAVITQVKGSGDRPVLCVSWVVPGAASPDLVDSWVASAMALGGARSKLDFTHVHDTHAHVEILEGASLFTLRVTLDHKLDEPELQKLTAELRDGPALALWSRRGDFLTRYAQVLMLVEGLQLWEDPPLRTIAQHYRATGDADFFGWWQNSVRDHLPGSLDDYLHTYLAPERASVVLIQPAGGAPAAEQTDAMGAPLHDESPHLDAASTAAAFHPTPEQLEKLALPEATEVTRHTLGNGLEVWVAPHPGHSLVDGRLVVRSDSSPNERAAAAIAFLAHEEARLTFGGGSNLALVGGSAQRKVDSEYLEVDVQAASGNLANALAELRYWVDTELNASAISDGRERLSRAMKKVEARKQPPPVTALTASRRITSAELGAVTAAEVQAWWTRQVDPRRAILVLAGDLQPTDELWTQLETWLGPWKPAEGPAPAPTVTPLPMPPQRRVVVIPRKAGELAYVVVTLSSKPLAPGQSTAIAVLRQQLERELTRTLREREGVTYVVDVAEELHRGGVRLNIRTTAPVAAVGDALHHVLDALQRLRTSPLDADAFDSARWAVARGAAGRFDTILGAAEVLSSEAIRMEPADAFRIQAHELAVLTPDQVEQAAALFEPKEEIFVTGPKEKVVAALQKAGFAVEGENAADEDDDIE